MKLPKEIIVPGFRGAGMSCGIKKSGEPDLALVVSDRPCVSAVVFTRSKVAAAPVVWGKGLRTRSRLRGIVANSGNANACTGAVGIRAVRRTSRAAARSLGLPVDSLLIGSTGVIGVPLPVEKIVAAMPVLAARLSPKGIAGAGEAILTTDAFPKRGSGRSTRRAHDHDRRDREGCRDDRTEHGNDARLRVHRRGPGSRRRPAPASGGGRRDVQPDRRRRRHEHQRHRGPLRERRVRFASAGREGSLRVPGSAPVAAAGPRTDDRSRRRGGVPGGPAVDCRRANRHGRNEGGPRGRYLTAGENGRSSAPT